MIAGRPGWWALVVVGITACEGPPPIEVDAGSDAAAIDGGTSGDAGPIECEAHADCDDGLYCTGEEACDPADPGADARGCVRRAVCSTSETCDEVGDRCVLEGCEEPDADGDGAESATCGGIDCDDGDGLRAPGNVEICDVADRDEDCDPTTFGVRDADADGYPDAACCNASGSGDVCGDDCNDASAAVHPATSDVCNDRDDDCDGAVDEDGMVLYLDCDGDSFGNSAVYRTGCPEPVVASPECPAPLPSSTWTTTPGDCDDARAATHPGATDTCNEIDDDCVLPVDPPTCLCTEGETTRCGYDTMCREVEGSCVAGAFACAPGLRTGAEAEVCNGVDDNCDGGVDEGCPCRPVGAMRSCAADGRMGACAVGMERCDPAGWSGCAVPEAEECAGGDQDCDGTTDEGMHLWQVAIPSPCSADALHASHLCAQHIANACGGRTPPGMQCAASGGFGHVEAGAGSIDVVCNDLPVQRYVPGSTLRGHHPGCTASDADYSACRAAINRYCAAAGGAGGYGWIDGTDTWSVQCVGSAQGLAFGVSWAELSARQPMCTGFPANTLYCPNAAHRYCQARGFAAGFGPVEQSPGGATVLCVRDF